MQENAVNCTIDKKWIHKQCSDVHGDLSLGVHVDVDGFRCKRCDGTIPEANIAENLVVDGETYWCVKSFCFVWDTVDGDGGAHLAATPVVALLFATTRSVFKSVKVSVVEIAKGTN